MTNDTEKNAAFDTCLAEYKAPALEELVLCKTAIIAGRSTDDTVDNVVGENEEGF